MWYSETNLPRETVDANRRAASDKTDARRWYVIHAVAGMETTIRDQMWCYGIDVWLPMKKENQCCHRRRGGGGAVKFRVVEKPALTGYLFVECTMSDECWHGLTSFDGVIEILGTDSRPLPVADGEINRIALLIEKRLLDFSTGRYQFSAGDSVTINDPRMPETKGVVGESYAGTGIVPVLVDGMGRETIVMVGVDQLEKIA